MISFCIATYNQLEYVKYQIKVFEKLYKQFKNFEIIFADDGSSDGTTEYINSSKFQFDCKSIYISKEGFRKSIVTDMSIRESNNDYVWLIDVDTFISEKSIEIAKDIINSTNMSKTILMGIRKRVDWNKLKELSPTNDSMNSVVVGDEWRIINDIPTWKYRNFSGSNVIFRKIDYLESKGFPKHFKGRGYDDYYMVLSMLVIGCKVKACRNLVSYHILHPNIEASEDNNYKLKQYEKELKERILKLHGNIL
jgi:glycosyltransferase involved in cell wall biosynthesis